MEEPLVDEIDALAEELSNGLSSAVQRFVLDGRTGLDSWQAMMFRELKDPLVEYLVEEVNNELVGRRLNPISRERAIVLVGLALSDTDDLRSRILAAPNPDEVLVSGGRFSLGTLTGRVHQLGIVKSLIRVLTGRATSYSAENGVGYSGRKRWRTSVASSRHSALNFVEADANGKWFVGPGAYWSGPREDVSFAVQASGCRCFVQYLYITENGEEEWL